MTRVRVLTPAGSGAIATVEVAGPGAWDAVRTLFRPAAGTLPNQPPLHRVWFGNIGDGAGDEVVVAVRHVEPVCVIEVHCHGGRQVVRWVVGQFESVGCASDERKPTGRGGPWALLQHAPTLRTASILLDQCHVAFAREVAAIQSAADAADRIATLAAYAPVGRHLVEPWRVVVAGPPNVGKSSLVNALAGFQRSVVSDTAGTTRDVVTTRVAFDGWPVELADTAGLRRAADSLEAEGVALARRFLADADLVVWVLDATSETPEWPTTQSLVVANKTDHPVRANVGDSLRVSAATGAGIPELIAAIVANLVQAAPPPGAAVPYTPALADATVAARRLVAAGNLADARAALAAALADHS